MAVTYEQARAAKELAKTALASWSSIINGIGLTKVGENWVIAVNLTRPVPGGEKLPKQVGGVRVVTEVVGGVGAFGG